MAKSAKRLGELLVEQGILTEDQVQAGLVAQKQLGVRLGTALVRKGLIKEETLARFLSLQFGVPSINLSQVQFPTPASHTVPVDVQQRLLAVPIALVEKPSGNSVVIAMADPMDAEANSILGSVVGTHIQTVIATESSIRSALGMDSSVDFEFDRDSEEMVIIRGVMEQQSANSPDGTSTASEATAAQRAPEALLAEWIAADPRRTLTALVDVLVRQGALSREDILRAIAEVGE